MVFSKFSGLVIVFLVVSAVSVFMKDKFAAWNIDYLVVLGANTLLFLLSVLSLVLHIRALTKPNPQVFVRTVMLANIIKLLGLAAAALIYISLAKKSTSANAVFAGLFLYIVYTWVEKRATIALSKTRKS
jgi:hypothetical protein